MDSIDLHTHHATRASSVSGTIEMPPLPESMVKSEAGRADEGYFVLTLSLQRVNDAHLCSYPYSSAQSHETFRL
jgi:hypothetical protein